MADPKVDTTVKEEASIVAIEDVARELLEITDISDNTKFAIEWALDGVVDAIENGVNEAQADQVLETVIRANLQEIVSGAPDDQMPRIEELLNKMIAGLDEGFFNIGNYDEFGNAGTPEEKAQRKAQRAMSDLAFVGALNKIDVDPEKTNEFYKHLQANLTPEIKQSISQVQTIITDISKNGNADPAVINRLKTKIQEIETEIHEIIKTDPQFAALGSDDEREAYTQALLIKQIAESSNDPKLTEDQVKEMLTKLAEDDPEAVVAILQSASAEIKSEAAQSNVVRSVNEVMASITGGFNNTDPNMSDEKQTDVMIGNIQKAIAAQGENGILIREQQDALNEQLESLQSRLISATNETTITLLSNQVYGLKNQIAELENTFDQTVEVNAFLGEVIGFINENQEAILNCKDPQAVIALAMDNENLVAAYRNVVETLEPEERETTFLTMAVALGISEEDAKTAYNELLEVESGAFQLSDITNKIGEVANWVSSIFEHEEDDIVKTLETKIAELTQEKEAFEASMGGQYPGDAVGNYIRAKVDGFNASIAELENDLTKFKQLDEAKEYLIELKAQLEAAAQSGENTHLSPEMIAQRIAEQEAQIQQIKDEYLGNGTDADALVDADTKTDAPAPEWNTAQAYLDAHPEVVDYLTTLTTMHGISEADLRTELGSLGVPTGEIDGIVSIAETDYSANVAPKIDTVVNNDFQTTSAQKGPGELLQGTFSEAMKGPDAQVTPTPNGPQIMTPEEIAAAEQELAANTTTDKPTVTTPGVMGG